MNALPHTLPDEPTPVARHATSGGAASGRRVSLVALTVEDLQAYVASGRLRFVLVGGQGRPGGGSSESRRGGVRREPGQWSRHHPEWSNRRSLSSVDHAFDPDPALDGARSRVI